MSTWTDEGKSSTGHLCSFYVNMSLPQRLAIWHKEVADPSNLSLSLCNVPISSQPVRFQEAESHPSSGFSSSVCKRKPELHAWHLPWPGVYFLLWAHLHFSLPSPHTPINHSAKTSASFLKLLELSWRSRSSEILVQYTGCIINMLL